MRKTRFLMSNIAIVAGLVFAAGLVAHAQEGNAQGKTAEQVYKNIKVLNGTPADQLIESMHLIRGALGVDCEFCHEDPDRAADTKKPKETARKMITMMMDINKNNFNGRQEVTCYTCHRGSTDPVGTLILPAPEQPEDQEARANLPSADQILAKYVEALGGEQAIRKVTSRVITGTQFVPSGPGGAIPVPAAVERDEKSPNLVVSIYKTPTYTLSNGFDGSKAWAQDARGRVNEPGNTEQMRAKRDSDFYLSLDLKQNYTQMRVVRTETVNGHEAYLVVARPQGDSPERLYFDVHSGLLLRKLTVLPTPLGNSPYQVDYDDYRDTGSGVKFPFLITMNPATPESIPSTTATLRVTKVEDNAQVDAAKFNKPESKATGRGGEGR
jgi:photosynthetic reaction center cytochrome c subunit